MSAGLEARAQEPPSPGIEALRREMERIGALASRDRGLLDAILNHIPSGLIVCDAAGRLTLVNRAAERIWGGSTPVERLSDWTHYRAFHPDGRPFAVEDWSMARVLATGRPVEPEEIEIERFDGGRGFIVSGAAPILDAQGATAGAVGIFSEVTAAKARERELLDLERRTRVRLARLQALTSALSEAVSVSEVARAALAHALDALPSGGSGALWLRDAAGGDVLVHAVGVSDDEHDRYQRAPPPIVAEVLREGQAVWLSSTADVALACLPLTVKRQCIGGALLAFPGGNDFGPDERTFLLVAVRHVAQALERARLYEAEQHARAEAVAAAERSAFLNEAGALLASSLDCEPTLAGIARLAVPRVADWCAVDLAEDVGAGRPPVAVAHVEGGERVERPALAAALRTGRAEFCAERCGMVVPMIARGRTLGALTFLGRRRYGPADLEMAENLARRAALAVDNARLYAQAQQAARAREEVVAIVAHDLKNPLNAVLMSAGLLRRSEHDPARVRHHAEAIERAVHRMRNLVHDLLDLARMEAGRFTVERQPQAAGALVSDVVTLLQPLASEKGVALDGEAGAAGAARASCDRERVLQVLSNLIGNAITFTPAGGRVTVSVEPAGREVTFSVADTGPGVDAGEQGHVFDRFWKSRASRQGTGLGLSIAKGIVDAHGGRIWVESRPGQGAVFRFTLPAEP